MSYDWDQEDMVTLVKTYASSSAYYQWNGDPLVSDMSTFNDAPVSSERDPRSVPMMVMMKTMISGRNSRKISKTKE